MKKRSIALLVGIMVILTIAGGVALAADAPNFTVNYDLNYTGAGLHQIDSILGGTVISTAPSAPSRTGYGFGGWFKNSACSTGQDWTFGTGGDTVQGDTTLYADWSANDVVVTFVANGGTETPVFNGKYGGTVTAPSAPTRAGYTFQGWYRDMSLTAPWDFANTLVDANTPGDFASGGDINLYASWLGGGINTATQFVVSYKWNYSGSTGADFLVVAVPKNTAISAPTAPTRPGWTFEGWYQETGTTTLWDFAGSSSPTIVNDNKSIWAKWSENHYSVTYNENGGLAVTVDDPAILHYGDNVGTLPTTTKAGGYTLAGWYYDSALTQLAGQATATAKIPGTDVDKKVSESITLYAKWVQGYVITLHRNDGTSSDIMSFTGSNVDGTVSQPPITSGQATRTGYIGQSASTPKFYTDAAGSTEFKFGNTGSSTATKVSADTPLYLKWIPLDSLKVYFNSRGGSAVDTQYVSATGSLLITKPADPTRAGYTLEGWYSVLDGTTLTNKWNFATMTATDGMTLYANWVKAQTYRVSFIVNDAVYSYADYTYGALFSIPAPPTVPGQRFDHWYLRGESPADTDHWLRYAGDGLGSAPALYTDREIEGNVEYVAALVAIDYTVKFETDQGTPEGSRTEQYGHVVTEPVKSAAGYAYQGWYTTAGVKWNFASDRVTGDLTLVCRWTPAWTVTLNTGASTEHLTGSQAVVGDSTVNWTAASGSTSDYALLVPTGSKLLAPNYGGDGVTLGGYEFDGWYKDSTYTQKWTFGASGDTVSAPTTLYAKLVRETWTQTFYPENGTDTFVKKVDTDKSTVVVDNPSLTGFLFAGWDGYHQDSNFDGNPDWTPVGGTTTITGIHQADQYKAVWTKDVTSNKLVTYRWGMSGNGVTEAQNIYLLSSLAAPAGVPLPAISFPGLTFLGWYVDLDADGVYEAGSASASGLTVGALNIDIVAKWDIDLYKVSFDSQLGTAVTAKTGLHYGDGIAAPTAPTRGGMYTFGGWYKEAACVTPFKFSAADGVAADPGKDAVVGSITLYAKWYLSYVVSFNDRGSVIHQAVVDYSISDGRQAIENKSDTADQAPADPTWTNHTFEGWYTAATGGSLFLKSSFPVLVGADITVYAQWSTSHTHTVAFNSDGGSFVPSQTVPMDGLVVAPVAPVQADHVFKYWALSTDLTKPFLFTTPVVADITLKALWYDDVTVTIYALDGATVVVPPYFTAYNSIISAPSTPTTHSTRVWNGKWYTNTSYTSEFNFATPVTDNLTLYPGYLNASKQTVTFDPDGGSPTPTSPNLLPGSKVTEPTGVTRNGYILTGWFVTSGGVINSQWNFSTNVVGNAALVLKAHWAWALNVTYSWGYAAPGGATTTVKTAYNQTTTPPIALARAGWEFAGWYTDPTFASHWSMWQFATDKVMANMTLYAKWNDVGDHSIPVIKFTSATGAAIANWGTTWSRYFKVTATDNALWWRAAWRNGVRIAWPWGAVYTHGAYTFMAGDYSGNVKLSKLWLK